MNAQWRSRIVLGLAMLPALLLHGCGSGFSWADYELDDTTYGRPTPLSGRYAGSLRDFGSTATYWFRLVSTTEAQGRATLGGEPVDLVGAISDGTHLRLEGVGLVIEGDFSGAYHPLDSSYYEWRGVEFHATWRRDATASGTATAYHEAWPPNLYNNNHHDDDWYDDWDDNDWDWSGGSDGSGGGGGSGDSGGTDTGGGGGSGGTDPVDGSGDSTDDSVVWRGPKGRR